MESYGEHERGFWRPSTIAAGIILLLVLIAGGILIAVSGSNNTSHPNAAQQPSPVSSSKGSQPTSPETTPINDRGCSLSVGDQTIPEATPPGITWELYQTVALPFSKTDGPQLIDGDVARCYAHNPIGALLAASQIPYRALIAPDWRAVTLQQVIPGVGRSTYIAERAKVTNQGGNQPGDYTQLVGFKFVTYSPAVAVIELVAKSDNGVMQATTNTVDWSGGDWKEQLQPDGSDSPNVLPVTSLVGFSTWSGV